MSSSLIPTPSITHSMVGTPLSAGPTLSSVAWSTPSVIPPPLNPWIVSPCNLSPGFLLPLPPFVNDDCGVLGAGWLNSSTSVPDGAWGPFGEPFPIPYGDRNDWYPNGHPALFHFNNASDWAGQDLKLLDGMVVEVVNGTDGKEEGTVTFHNDGKGWAVNGTMSAGMTHPNGKIVHGTISIPLLASIADHPKMVQGHYLTLSPNTDQETREFFEEIYRALKSQPHAFASASVSAAVPTPTTTVYLGSSATSSSSASAFTTVFVPATSVPGSSSVSSSSSAALASGTTTTTTTVSNTSIASASYAPVPSASASAFGSDIFVATNHKGGNDEVFVGVDRKVVDFLDSIVAGLGGVVSGLGPVVNGKGPVGVDVNVDVVEKRDGLRSDEEGRACVIGSFCGDGEGLHALRGVGGSVYGV